MITDEKQSIKLDTHPVPIVNILDVTASEWMRIGRYEIIIFMEGLESHPSGHFVVNPQYFKSTVAWNYLVEKDNFIIVSSETAVFVLDINKLVKEDVHCQSQWKTTEGIWFKSWEDTEL